MHGFPLNWLPLADVCLLLCRENPRTHIPLGPHIQHPIPLTFSAPTLTLNEHRQHSQPPKSLLGGPRLPLPSTLHLASPLVSRRDLTPVLRSPVSRTHGLDEGRCQSSVTCSGCPPTISPRWGRPLLFFHCYRRLCGGVDGLRACLFSLIVSTSSSPTTARLEESVSPGLRAQVLMTRWPNLTFLLASSKCTLATAPVWGLHMAMKTLCRLWYTLSSVHWISISCSQDRHCQAPAGHLRIIENGVLWELSSQVRTRDTSLYSANGWTKGGPASHLPHDTTTLNIFTSIII